MSWTARSAALAGIVAMALATAGSAGAAPTSDTVITVPMTWSAASSTVHPDGTSGRVPGTCGFAKFDTRASTRQYDLTLWSTAGAMGTGSYGVTTNGIGAVEQPGVVNAGGRALWSSNWQTVLVPGFGPKTANLTGFVLLGNGVCGFSLSAPWT